MTYDQYRRLKTQFNHEEIKEKSESEGYSFECPESPGRYLFRCFETDYETEVIDIEENLFCDMPDCGRYPVSMLHDNLTYPHWKKVHLEVVRESLTPD